MLKKNSVSSGQARKGLSPFVWKLAPLVWNESAPVTPFVRKYIPSVCVTPSNAGFTLIEALVTVVIAGILTALAVPAVTSMVNSNRLTTTTNEFIGDLNLARSEALKRASNAVVCPSSDGTSCAAGGTWTSGWIVFADANNDGILQTASGDLMLRVHESVSNGTAITASSDTISFSRQGLIPAVGAGLEWGFAFCNNNIGQSRTVSVPLTGRVRLAKGTC